MKLETRGGFHIMVRSDTIKGNYVHKAIKEAQAMTQKEVCFNPNGMVPMPGTMHAGFSVKVRKDLSILPVK